MQFFELTELPFLHEVTSFKLVSAHVMVGARQLRAVWTPELAQDLGAYHDIDAEAELTALLEAEFAPRQGIVTRYARQLVHPEYFTMRVTNTANPDGVEYAITPKETTNGLQFFNIENMRLPTTDPKIKLKQKVNDMFTKFGFLTEYNLFELPAA